MLEKQLILKSVEIINNEDGEKSMNVRWDNNIIEDGVILSSIPHRCAYTFVEKERFIAEVDDAEKWLEILGWE